MKNILSLALLGCLLSSCSFFYPHKMDIEQGNIIVPQDVRSLSPGMSEHEVRDIMGNPVLVNILTPNRLEYVYTFQPGYENMREQRVTCLFKNHRLQEVITR